MNTTSPSTNIHDIHTPGLAEAVANRLGIKVGYWSDETTKTPAEPIDWLEELVIGRVAELTGATWS